MRNVSLSKIINLMRKYLMKGCMIFFLILSCKNAPHKDNPDENNEFMYKRENQAKILRHIVLLKFKEEATDQEIKDVEEAFGELPLKIKEIRDFEWGINNSPEGINMGFTHGFLLTFNSESDRDIYLPHPDHKAFGKILSPVLEDVLVLDYWTN